MQHPRNGAFLVSLLTRPIITSFSTCCCTTTPHARFLHLSPKEVLVDSCHSLVSCNWFPSVPQTRASENLKSKKSSVKADPKQLESPRVENPSVTVITQHKAHLQPLVRSAGSFSCQYFRTRNADVCLTASLALSSKQYSRSSLGLANVPSIPTIATLREGGRKRRGRKSALNQDAIEKRRGSSA